MAKEPYQSPDFEIEEYPLEKAVASTIFTEVAEKLHADGRLTDAEFEEMNKAAVNRAYAVLRALKDDEATLGLKLKAMKLFDWDAPKDDGEFEKLKDAGKKALNSGR